MSRIILPIGILLGCTLISACAASTTQLHYGLTIDNGTPAQVVNLINASERVMKRRISALGVQTPNVIAVPTGGSGGTLTIDVPDEQLVTRIQQILAEKFTFDMRLELKETTAQDQNAEENWEKLGVENQHLIGVQVVGDEKTGEVAVELLFTDEGRDLLSKAFAKYKGRTVGIFVRGVLVSKLKVENDAVSDHVVISGIPSAAVAQIFADDVNVGLHVAFTPTGK
ncbi:MAG TPA: hypothetical protein PKV72_03375 [Candidatus Peribacteria bacterium]|nr:hypothetical protein [Candidatus Peribacteria bacterium]